MTHFATFTKRKKKEAECRGFGKVINRPGGHSMVLVFRPSRPEYVFVTSLERV